MRNNNNNKKATNYLNDYLPCEILVTIFTALNVAEIVGVSRVCKSWNRATRDSELWHKLDLTQLNSASIYFNLPLIPSALRDKRSRTQMAQFLKYALSLSNGSVSCLVFNFFVYLTDVHLITAAVRTPNLKKLVLPRFGKLTKMGISIAMRLWEGLESITVTSMVKHDYLFPAIGKYCKNITELKFTCNFAQEDADALIKYTPNLKLLSVRNIIVNMRGLCKVVNSLEHLEVVNICHCLIIDEINGQIKVYPIHSDLQDHLGIVGSRKLLFCQNRRCLRCKNSGNGDLVRRPYRFLEDMWREDEIRTLAH